MNNPAAITARLKRRHRAEQRFKCYGFLAVIVSFVFLGILMTNIVGRGYSAFVKTTLTIPVNFSHDVINIDEPEKADYSILVRDALKTRFPDATDRQSLMSLYGLVSKGAAQELRDAVLADPSLVGTIMDMEVTASADVDMYAKGYISKETPPERRRIKDKQIVWIESLEQQYMVHTRFNTTFFTSGDSREPEQAGIIGSLVGSLLTVIICMGLATPLAVMTAVYLEEFAPKNKITDAIEVNINNLAAVPSIVFGLLGLAIYLAFFNLPRSSSLVAGLTLALMAMPTIVITTRNALKAVPPSIKDGAMALGASPIQVMWHHTLPLAMPGVMTGCILAIARVLGETAPLLMVGMVAFVADVPRGFLDPATVMPVQIFLWSDSPELAFIEKTSAAIMVLLVFLIVLNAVAVYLRKKYEHRW